jgi:kynurenine formamidase
MASLPLRLALLLCGCCLAACATAPRPAAEQAEQIDQTDQTVQQTVTFARVVDLSHTITQNMPHAPDAPPTLIQHSSGQAGSGMVAQVQLGVRSGTALSLPAASAAQAEQSDAPPVSIDQLSPRQLIAPAVVLDVRAAVQDYPGYTLHVEEIEAWEAQHGTIPADALVLLATGWDMRWGNVDAYLQLDAQDQMQVPAISPAALDLLLHERGVRGVGIDTPALLREPAPAAADTWLLLTNLTNVEQLPARGATLSIGVLKLQGSHASPVRVLALVP